MIYEIIGTYVEKGEEKKFRMNIEAQNEKTAREKTYSKIGSNHAILRRKISIVEIKGGESK
jgi:ribosomal protein L20A (L18A)